MSHSAILSGNLHATVKSREIQRGLFAEMAGDRTTASRHYLAAAYLELVLAEDYKDMGRSDLANRSRISAASCFWKAGELDHSRRLLADLGAEAPESQAEFQRVLEDLSQNDANA